MIARSLTVADFESAWNEALTPFLRSKVAEYTLDYYPLSVGERDEAIRMMVDFLLQDFVVYAGEHRQSQWEQGWGENLVEFQKTRKIEAITPRYFGKYPYVRFRQELLRGESTDFEVNLVSILQYWLFEKYLKGFPTVYEFGCGTGHNLLRLREINRDATLWGYDWAESSQLLLKGIAEVLPDDKLRCGNFDYFCPDSSLKLDANGAVFTFASLEQTGSRYGKFIDFLISNKVQLCVHVEPTGETLDEANLLDYLSMKYFQKRKYLDGFIEHLRERERSGEVEIINVQRSYIGSLFIDGYSIVVWRPL